jgi:hypothetical protein
VFCDDRVVWRWWPDNDKGEWKALKAAEREGMAQNSCRNGSLQIYSGSHRSQPQRSLFSISFADLTYVTCLNLFPMSPISIRWIPPTPLPTYSILFLFLSLKFFFFFKIIIVSFIKVSFIKDQ